jgi:integrase
MIRGLPASKWPQADRTAWASARAPGDIFEPGGAAAHWRTTTAENFENEYGVWLAWLAANDALDGASKPEDRVTQDRVAAFVEEMQAVVTPATVANRVARLHTAMRLFAGHLDWKWLADAKTQLRRRATPTKAKPEALTHPSDLYAVGHRLMDEADASLGLNERKRAVIYRDGLMIAILAARAPRRRTLAAMRLSTNLHWNGETYWLVFAADDTKQRRAAEHMLPAGLTSRIDVYLSHYREALAKGPNAAELMDWVWLTERGGPLSAMAINAITHKRTKAALGVAIPPHRFRDCLATAWATDLPEQVRLAGSMLDHRNPETTEAHYNQAQRNQALRMHHATMNRLRERNTKRS